VPDRGPLDNAAIATALHEYAALLELSGAGHYSSRAFRRGAELIASTPVPVAELVQSGRVRELRGIGPGIEARLRELVETGRIAEVEELRRETSPELAALGRLLGFGAQLGAAIGTTLDIRTAAELRTAASAGRLRAVPGIGPRTEARILAALAREAPAASRPLRLDRARAQSEKLARALQGIAAGDARRFADAPGRLVVVVESEDAESVRTRFAALPEIVTMLAPETGITAEGLPVELVIAAPETLGTALVRATGSAEYVASLGPLPDARDEESVYRLLGRPYAPPELRELPARSVPPALVELEDIRGDLHCHTRWSDGKATVLEMAAAAIERGYEYLAICDHTRAVRVVPGLDADDLRRQAIEIGAANAALAPFRVLRGAECDILPDGSLDLPDDILSELDWVQLSLHAGQRAPRRELTARVTHAMQHPAVRCLSHPTGRLIGHRPANALDLEKTFQTAVDTGVALEVNGLPDRLDLSGEHVRLALEAGVAIVCSTDAHSTGGLQHMPLSVHTARRGGATPASILNTQPLARLLDTVRRSRTGAPA
jgi:DNA polymerase (family 10)